MPYSDREQQREYQRKWSQRRYELKRQLLVEQKARGCVRCGETDPVCLSFHHLDPDQKLFEVGGTSRTNEETLLAEMAKCVVLCENCHRKLHAGRFVL